MAEDSGGTIALGEARESDIDSRGKRYRRIVIHTHYIEAGEEIGQVARKYLEPLLRTDDIIFVSEKVVSVSKGHWVEESTVKPGWWARFLNKFVVRTPSGPGGVGSPEKMQLAIERVGLWRVLLAAAVSAVTKLFGIKGLFYRIVGPRVSTVDGQTGPPHWPARTRIIFPVPNPDEVAREIASCCGNPAIIADMNNISGTIKGFSEPALKEIDFVHILRDNPMGQQQTMTPIGIIRPLSDG